MRKYRILTNGIKFKAQIRDWTFIFPYWASLQNNQNPKRFPPMMRDILYDSYEDAEKSIIKYGKRLHEKET